MRLRGLSPTPRAAAALAAIAFAALVAPLWIATLAALALAGAVLADGFALRGEVEVARELPELLSRGVEEGFALELAGPAGARRWVRQPAPPDVELQPAEGAPPLRGTIAGRRRGVRRLGAVGARIEGPLRLAATYRRAGGGLEVRVFPDLPAARRAVDSVRRERLRGQDGRGRGPLGLGTEFERVREYSPDDDIRQVNWRATARLGRPMSNDYRLEQDRDVIALLDCGRLMAAPAGAGTLHDAALDALTALAAVADELGDRFGAIAFDSELRAELAPARRGGARAVHALFDLEPRLLDSDYGRAFRKVRASKRALVVLFSDLLEQVAARPLLEAVPVLARRHALAILTASDPALEAAVARPAAGELGAYRAAAALDVLAARRETVARLRRAGAHVAEAPAAGLGPAAVRSYLRAKSRALL